MSARRPLVLCLGKFDALHRGHRALAERAASLGRVALLRLEGMDASLGWAARAPLTATGDRTRVLDSWGLQPTPKELVLDFPPLRDLTAADFLALLVRDHGVGAVVCGADFRFGRDRIGHAGQLPQLCPPLELGWSVVPPVLEGGAPISSSRVRQALALGDVALAERLSGRPHRLVGLVVPGDRRGRTLGFPTANLATANAVPAPGVYAGRAVLGAATIVAVINIGSQPTVGSERQLRVEVHLLDWSGDCYGALMAVDVLQRLRDEQRFPGLPALRAAIGADVAAARRRLAVAP